MRCEILQELKKRHNDAVHSKKRQTNGKLSVVDQMVAQYFQRHGYHYSLSIYAAESGIENSQGLTPMETLRVLGLNGWPKFVQIVSDNLAQNPAQGALRLFHRQSSLEPLGLLVVLLESMALFLNSVPDLKGRQQDTSKTKADQSDAFLKTLEENYANAVNSFQDEVLEVKKHNNEQIEEEMKEFKSKETEELKANEEAYWRRQMQYHKENLDEAFQKRVAALKEKESYLVESCNHQKAELEHKSKECQQRALQEEMFLRSKHSELERAFSKRQAHVNSIENQLNEREQKLVQIEHELQQKLIGWANKEKHYEAQAHLRVQQSLVNEQEELTKWRLQLQEEWAKLEQERGQFMKEKEHQQQKLLSMETDLRMSEEKAFQLKENEEVLIQQIHKLQNELVQFQVTFLKSHNVPINKNLTQFKEGGVSSVNGGLDRIQIVRQIITQMIGAQNLAKEWKGRFKTEKVRRRETRRNLSIISQENKTWKQKCQCIEEVAKEAIQETERLMRNWSESKHQLRQLQQERLVMQAKIQKLQEDLETAKSNQRDGNQASDTGIDAHISALLADANSPGRFELGTLDSYYQDRPYNSQISPDLDYRALENEERQCQHRLNTFKDRMHELLTPVSPKLSSYPCKFHRTKHGSQKQFQLPEVDHLEHSSDAGASSSSSTETQEGTNSESEHSSPSTKTTILSERDLSEPRDVKNTDPANSDEFETIQNNAKQLLCIMQSETEAATAVSPNPTPEDSGSISLLPITSKESPTLEQALETTVEKTVSISAPPEQTETTVQSSSSLTCAPLPETNVFIQHPFAVECSFGEILKTPQCIMTTETPPQFSIPSQSTPVIGAVPTLQIPDHFAALFSTSISAPTVDVISSMPLFNLPPSVPVISETGMIQTVNETVKAVDSIPNAAVLRGEEQTAPLENGLLDHDSLPTTEYGDDFEDLEDLDDEDNVDAPLLNSTKGELNPPATEDTINPISDVNEEGQQTESSLPDELEGFSDTSF
eukprot:g7780.t1